MLGILISESIEVLYSVIKLTYDTGRGIYYWYYDEELPENKKIYDLENRIINLENQLNKKEK
jgi:hypothetical protein